ncbi:hypothetical protein P168DRAFT_289886 [Aspergillus campestris IBT 28561]|uniref:Uncharacterized protein n=1 Tax=Aspergillus campestris (strain IBT 28561) TaxID=1392248 RepID=A0A2I1D5B3_ASPC2|nr:uncharacterized protein P168DRAFT_289886 [Aspergillus campestris IBT 28561]PKY05067.1 hypothetical protein P168DRAFT_289886 [Aspergillus campestris IBT 28561]
MDPLRYLAAPHGFTPLPTANTKQIKERISFVDSLTANPHFNPSEPAREALYSYKDACETLVDLAREQKATGTSDASAQASATSQASDFEAAHLSTATLSFDLATKAKLGEELDALYNMWTFTRYERFLPEEVKADARAHPSASTADPWHGAFWTAFWARLQGERETFARVLAGEWGNGGALLNECPWSLLLALLCERHTVDWDETLALVQFGAGEAPLPQEDFVDLLKAGDAVALARRLDRDESAVSLSAEYVMGVGTLLMAYFSNTLSDAFFDTLSIEEKDGEDEEDDEEIAGYAMWKPKEALLERMALKDGHEESMRKLFQEMFDEMGADEDGDFEDDEEDEEMEDLDLAEAADFADGGFSDDSEDY